MKLLFFLNTSMILFIAFLVSKKRLSWLENFYLLFVLEFILSSYFALLYVNLEVWTIDEQAAPFINFLLFELILIPVIMTIYFNFISALTSRWMKLSTTIGIISLCYCLEYVLVQWKVIVYNNWHYWQSFMWISLILAVTYIIFLPFKYLLRKEGVIK